MTDRRNWTQAEEDALITILQDIVVIGGRGDNGSFRAGTYEQVVQKMQEKIVGIKITAKNVQNKIKRLKEKFSAAYDMVNTSGFGWDDVQKCVIVDAPEILEEYLKVSSYILFDSVFKFKLFIICVIFVCFARNTQPRTMLRINHSLHISVWQMYLVKIELLEVWLNLRLMLLQM